MKWWMLFASWKELYRYVDFRSVQRIRRHLHQFDRSKLAKSSADAIRLAVKVRAFLTPNADS